MQAWAEDMEILVCPVARIPLSALLVGSDGKDEPIQSVPAQLQELPEGFTLFHQQPTGLHSGFSVRVYSHSLHFSQSNHKAVVVLRQVVLGYRVPVAGKRCTWNSMRNEIWSKKRKLFLYSFFFKKLHLVGANLVNPTWLLEGPN